MKKALIILSFSPLLAFAQYNQTDTIKSKELHEVVIEASNQQTSSNLSTYIPLAQQKNSAGDAISLLSQMAIPQISVDPINQAVKTASGQAVSIFIDFLPATSQDLQGMRTQDVKRVEYYLHPSDPRFQGANYAINFIMQKYEWGGYTKLSANKWFGVNRNEAGIYSKMAYKSMTFDVYANEIYLTNRHRGTYSNETFHFNDLYGNGPQTVTRTSDTESSLYRNNSSDIAIRALYNSNKARISNNISYSLTNIPHSDEVNSVSYSSEIFSPSTASSLTSSRDWALSYYGNFYFYLSSKFSFEADAFYKYGKNKSYSSYTTSNELDITNNAFEDAQNFSITPRVNWQIDDKNIFIFSVSTQKFFYDIDYLGSSPSHQKYNIGAYAIGANYSLSLNKWNIGAGLGWIWQSNNISDCSMNSNFPQSNVYFTYSPTDKHQFEFNLLYDKSIPGASKKSPNMLQQDELMWYQGTSSLSDFPEFNMGLNHTWLPNNKWQISTTAFFYTINNRCVAIYSPTAPDGTMLRKYFNDGNYRIGMLGSSLTGKFFGSKLIANVNPQFWIRKTTGAYPLTKTELTVTSSLSYYFGKFFANIFYMTPSHYQEEDSGIVERTPSSYQITLGWAKNGWNIKAGTYNFLRTSWESSRQTLSSTYYSFDNKIFSTAKHWRLTFSVSYTFGYGKKINRGNEVSGSGTASSAILK